MAEQETISDLIDSVIAHLPRTDRYSELRHSLSAVKSETDWRVADEDVLEAFGDHGRSNLCVDGIRAQREWLNRRQLGRGLTLHAIREAARMFDDLETRVVDEVSADNCNEGKIAWVAIAYGDVSLDELLRFAEALGLTAADVTVESTDDWDLIVSIRSER